MDEGLKRMLSLLLDYDPHLQRLIKSGLVFQCLPLNCYTVLPDNGTVFAMFSSSHSQRYNNDLSPQDVCKGFMVSTGHGQSRSNCLLYLIGKSHHD